MQIFFITIVLENQYIEYDEIHAYRFDIDDYRKKFLIKGLDEIGQTLQYLAEIKEFEKDRKQNFPWLF